jgi:hypothetical protein
MDANPKTTFMLELAKDFKASIITMLKDTKKNILNKNEKIGNAI